MWQDHDFVFPKFLSLFLGVKETVVPYLRFQLGSNVDDDACPHPSLCAHKWLTRLQARG